MDVHSPQYLLPVVFHTFQQSRRVQRILTVEKFCQHAVSDSSALQQKQEKIKQPKLSPTINQEGVHCTLGLVEYAPKP